MADTILASAGGAVNNPPANRSEVSRGTSGLLRDQIALLTIFLIVVTYHIQNPILQFELQFGRAFRNATLQSVLALALIPCALLLIGNLSSLRNNSLRFAAAVGLAVFTLYIGLAVILKLNVLGLLLGVPQELFLDQLD